MCCWFVCAVNCRCLFERSEKLFVAQVCYTGTFAAYLPRWTIFRKASPIMQIVIDRDRQILYTRSQSGVIAVSLSNPFHCISNLLDYTEV